MAHSRESSSHLRVLATDSACKVLPALMKFVLLIIQWLLAVTCIVWLLVGVSHYPVCLTMLLHQCHIHREPTILEPVWPASFVSVVRVMRAGCLETITESLSSVWLRGVITNFRWKILPSGSFGHRQHVARPEPLAVRKGLRPQQVWPGFSDSQGKVWQSDVFWTSGKGTLDLLQVSSRPLVARSYLFLLLHKKLRNVARRFDVRQMKHDHWFNGKKLNFPRRKWCHHVMQRGGSWQVAQIPSSAIHCISLRWLEMRLS